MSSNLDAIKRVLDAFERSDWQEIDVRSGDLRVHLASASGPTSTAAPVAPAVTSSGTVAPEHVGVEEDPADTTPSAPVSIPRDAHVVTAPSPGIFWRAPEPGAPPFTDLGQTVEPASTLCIIEVMKLMSHLKAEVSGRVVDIYAENGVAVAKDQPLFAVAAEGPAS